MNGSGWPGCNSLTRRHWGVSVIGRPFFAYGVDNSAIHRMAKRAINFGDIHYRELRFTRESIADTTRTVDLAFSSEAPVERYFGTEVLSHKDGACDMSRLSDGAPLLLNHDPDKQIGVVESARIDSKDKVGRAKVRFSKSPLGEEVYQDVKDGIRSKVSVGYHINAIETENPDTDNEIQRCTSWTPGEISMVALPADNSVGVGRSQSQQPPTQIRMDKTETEVKPKPVLEPVLVDEGKVRGEAQKAERIRVKEINAIRSKLASKYPGVDIAKLTDSAIENGTSIEDVNRSTLEAITNAKPLETTTTDILSDARDFKKYNLSRAFLNAAENGGKLSGFELDVSQEVARRTNRTPRGFFVPNEILLGGARALSASSATAGGFLVATDLLTGEYVDLLRNRPVVEKMGCRRLVGLVGNVAIPKLTGAATAYWLPENGSVTESDQAFGQLVLTPHRLVADTGFSKELLAQNSLSTEAIVRDDLNRVCNLALDLAALAGPGTAGSPLGVYGTPGGATQVTFGAAATWAKAVSFETNVATGNADFGSLGFITSPAVRGKWKGIQKATNYPVYLWENDVRGTSMEGAPEGMVNGYRALVTNQVSATDVTGGPKANTVYFGNWNDLILASWAGIDFVLDPYSLKKTGQIEVTMTQLADIGIRHAASFCTSADSGAQ